MTKKDYEIIAAVIRQNAEHYPNGDAAQALYHVADSLASEFADRNERFEPGLFMEACGVGA